MLMEKSIIELVAGSHRGKPISGRPSCQKDKFIEASIVSAVTKSRLVLVDIFESRQPWYSLSPWAWLLVQRIFVNEDSAV